MHGFLLVFRREFMFAPFEGSRSIPLRINGHITLDFSNEARGLFKPKRESKGGRDRGFTSPYTMEIYTIVMVL
jgi:hypothetical protein